MAGVFIYIISIREVFLFRKIAHGCQITGYIATQHYGMLVTDTTMDTAAD